MGTRDKQLGMQSEITRRDFLNGVSVAVGASVFPLSSCSIEQGAVARPEYYPPGLTGLRGSHPGSFEAAHATVQGRSWNAEKSGEHYDLVVVGAGISGLAAAYFYRRDVDPNARVLILDNHDDFGGHAKRNEFEIDGRLYIGFGGTMLLEAPSGYPQVAKQLLGELDIDTKGYDSMYDDSVYASRGLRGATFFDKETFGTDRLTFGIEEMPLSDTAKAELEVLFADELDYLEGMSAAQRLRILESHSWLEYLRKYAGVGDEVLTYFQRRPHGVWAIGADALPAWMAWGESYPGFAGMDVGYELEENEWDSERIHFPDGNATIARLLVRKLVPSVAPGQTMTDIVTDRFDYSRLDRDDASLRIRLNSTVVGMEHQGGDLENDVDVSYVSGNKARSISASKVIWAGYHALVPHVCPDVTAEHVDAFNSSVRAPLVYTNVLIRNWKSFENLKLRRAYCPGSFFHSVGLDFPVSAGEYRFPESPDEPIVLHLQHIPTDPGKPAAEQFRAGRQFLLQTPFSEFERNVRDQLGRMLGAGGFDPARDIAAITVNRWPHGYAYSVDQASGDVAWWPQWWRHDQKPWVSARQAVGNIRFAGTDSSSNAMTESAIEEAHRAVQELM